MSANQTYLDQARNSFMLIQVSLSKYTGMVTLPKKLAKEYAESINVDPRTINSSIKVLGDQQHHHLAKVIGAWAAIRTYLYENTLPVSDAQEGQLARGDRLVPVARVPEVLTRLGELKAEAQGLLSAFLVDYPTYVKTAQLHYLGAAAKFIDHPSADEVKRKFACSISPPEQIPAADASKLRLPAGLAQQIADAANTKLERALKGAKAAAVDAAEKQMSVVVKQLSEGQRLHDSLIENSRRVAAMLRDMVSGYDNDPRLLALADLIDEKIGSIKDVSVWKDSDHKRAQSHRAAQTVVKGIADIKRAEKKQPAKVELAGGGLIADLL